jgi:hypothetical protein
MESYVLDTRPPCNKQARGLPEPSSYSSIGL